MRGGEIHKGWDKGAVIVRRYGYKVKLLDDGHYIDGGNFGLWHFRAVRENGMEESIVPEVGDVPEKEIRSNG